jgi:hypothetical protein
MLQFQKSKEVKKSTGRISYNTKCPIHLQASHTWGECYSNAANKNKPNTNSDKVKKRLGKSKKEEIDNVTHLANNDVSITSTVTSHGVDTMSTASEPCRQQAVNDNIMVSAINDGMFTQLCLDLNKKNDDPTALVAKFKVACAETKNAEANNGMYLYDAFTSITTHCHRDLSFHAMQEINTTVYNDIIRLYVQHSDEVYSKRVQNIAINCLLINCYDYMLLVMLLYERYNTPV